jgi:hydrogenase-4 component E
MNGMLGLVVLLAAAGLTTVRRLEYGAALLAVEGLAVAGVSFPAIRADWGGVALAIAVLAVKTLLIPGSIWRVVRELPPARRAEPPVTWWVYPVGALAVVLAFHALTVLTPTGVLRVPLLVFTGLASVHLALLAAVARRHVVSQVMALVAMENGTLVVAAGVAGHLPMVFDLGLVLDLGFATWVLTWLSARIHDTLEHGDVARLVRLRG